MGNLVLPNQAGFSEASKTWEQIRLKGGQVKQGESFVFSLDDLKRYSYRALSFYSGMIEYNPVSEEGVARPSILISTEDVCFTLKGKIKDAIALGENRYKGRLVFSSLPTPISISTKIVVTPKECDVLSFILYGSLFPNLIEVDLG